MSAHTPRLIAITCAHCGATFKVSSTHVGKKGRCPIEDCGAAYIVAEPRPVRRASESLRLPAAQARSAKRPARGIARQLWPLWSVAGFGSLVLISIVIWGTGAIEPNQVAAAKPDTYQQQIAPFVKKYCVECHGTENAEGGIALHSFDSEESVLKGRKHWEKVLPMLQIEAMPPVEDGRARPTHDEFLAVTAWLDDKLFNIDCKINRDPGRVTIRRLNRVEYNNTIRDLLGIDFSPANDFPSDDVGYGFDNIGDVLSVSPLLMEKYLDAAERISERVINSADPTKAKKTRIVGKQLKPKGGANDHGDGWAIVSDGQVMTEHTFPRAGEYLLRAQAMADQAGSELAKMTFQFDGKPAHTFEVKGQQVTEEFEFRMTVERGSHQFAAAFPNDFYDPKATKGGTDRNLYVNWLEVVGPLDVKPEDLPESHRKLIVATPNAIRPLVDAAYENLRPFLRRAFRRPVTDEEVSRFVPLVEMAVSQGETFERGMQFALQAVFCSPNFLFRIEQDANPNDPKAKHEISPFELATRLSYFLWSSMPDDELLSLAEHDELRKPEVVQQQVKRMLKDQRSKAIVENFAIQWLNLRSLNELMPDPTKFPDYTTQLRDDMRLETEKFFDHILREDLSTLELLDANFTFANERLAKHYGLDGVKGDEFQKVSLEKARGRAGLLTQASILTVTSNPGRTSPVKRGKWIMENILGTAPPPPPPNVPSLEVTQAAKPDASLRDQLKLHRENAMCNSCHRQMDDLGFGFENFDAIGRWRDRDGQHDVDASGVLPSGDKFNGSTELIAILKGRSKQFSRCLTEKLMTYAIGRGLEYYDRCAVDKVLTTHAADNYKFSTLISQIVLSEPFQMRRGDGPVE
ncbi:MAG: DUF1592 domain-containing protein [Planctomycetia bacterium]|nr:DUF1592 domain-containing protein [Planctomycetia bacterium]